MLLGTLFCIETATEVTLPGLKQRSVFAVAYMYSDAKLVCKQSM